MPSEPRNIRDSKRPAHEADESPHMSPVGSIPRYVANERLSSSPLSQRALDNRHSQLYSQSVRSELSGVVPEGSNQMSDDAVSIVVDPDEAARVLKRHLVTQPCGPEDDDSLAPTSDWDTDPDDGMRVLPNSHMLLGGDTTRHIYKWQEEQELGAASRRKRSQSVADLTSVLGDPNLPPNATANATVQSIKQPGGFRRHFLAQRAAQEGQPPPNFLTSNFIDFIALYGHFAGDEFPSDIDDDDYEGPPDLSSQYYSSTSTTRRRLAYRAIGDTESDAYSSDQELRKPRSYFQSRRRATMTERTPLRGTRTPVSARPVAAATATPKKAFFLLMKSFVGTGVLFLPRSFYNGGLTFSAFLLAFVAYLALYAMLLLVDCYLKIPGSFGDIGMALYGPKARYAVLSSIVLSQLGFCCAYTIFVARSLQELLQNVTDCRVNYSVTFWVFIQLAVYIPLAMVRKIKNFSHAALVADVFILLGLGYLYYFDMYRLATVGAAKIQHFNSANFSLFIGTAVFSFEGIGLVLPIVSSMKEPEKFPRVLTTALTVSAAIFISIGALSYLTFGDQVATVVLLNLPADDPKVHTVQFLYSLAIMFSVPLQMFPAIRILEAGLFVRSGKGNPWVKWQKNLFRILLVLFIALVSLLGAEKLDRFVALIGSLACIPLSFIYPSVFHLKAIARTRKNRLIDLTIFVFGVITMVYVTFTTIQSPGGLSDEEARQTAQTWRWQLGNLTYSANATQPHYPLAVQTNLTTMLLAYQPSPTTSSNYFRRLGAAFRGNLQSYNLTRVPGDNSVINTDVNSNHPTESTLLNTDWTRLELFPKETTNQSVAAVTGRLLLRKPMEIVALELRGLHYKENGTVYMVATELNNITHYLDVVRMMPDNQTLADARQLVDDMLPLDKLTEKLREQIIVEETDWPGNATNTDDRPTTSPISCTYDMFLQLHPVPDNIDYSSLADLEEELQYPTGKSTITMPALHASMIMYSRECQLMLISDPQLPLTGMKNEIYETKSVHYAAMAILIGLVQVLLTIHQIDYTLTPSSISKVSYWTVCIQTIMDAYVCIFHLSTAMASGSFFLPFIAAGFFTFTLASICEIRYLLVIWKVQQPESGEPILTEGQIAGPLYMRFCALFLVGLFIFYLSADGVTEVQRVILKVLFIIMFSFWIPQIYRNVKRGSSHALSLKYVMGMSITRLLYPLYAAGCPVSVISDIFHPEVYYLVVYVGLQIVVLLLQDSFGPRFCIPSQLIPPTYNYHPVLPPSDPESALEDTTVHDDHQNGRACTICMQTIDISAPSQILGRTVYMVTPCHHIFHTECLLTWMRTKLECPICRAPLPPT
ncbi:hypothetical protein IWQ61_003704 [Dispira simplex]|nr:hypothetical protein IWQ61_003704 [Dispira simplex]